MKELTQEKNNLDITLDIIKSVLKEEEKDLEKIYEDYNGTQEVLYKIIEDKKIHIINLESSLDKPYFARIDFKADDEDKISTIYIGKNGVMKNSDIVVTDWRAPISSLYIE